MGPRVRRTPEQAREALLDAAAEVVREVGPAGLRVTDVAKRAGMTHPNLLHHFGSREGLLDALTRRSMKGVAESVFGTARRMAEVEPKDRPKVLASFFEEMQEGGRGRMLVWLFLSGRVDGVSGRLEGVTPPDLGPVVQVAHTFRTGNPEDHGMEDTRRLLLLLALAQLGDAVAGDAFAEALGVDAGAEGMRRWLAHFVMGLADLD